MKTALIKRFGEKKIVLHEKDITKKYLKKKKLN